MLNNINNSLSCIDIPTIVYRHTKGIVYRHTKGIVYRHTNYRASTYQLSCIDIPRYRASTYQLSCIDIPRYRVSTYQLSCIDIPTIVYRHTNYRASTYLTTPHNPLNKGDRGTYPHPANLSLIYFNPPAYARERARRCARERLPSVHFVHCAPTFRWPLSASPSSKRKEGVGDSPSSYPTLKGTGQVIRLRSLLSLRSSNRKKKMAASRWVLSFVGKLRLLVYASEVYGLRPFWAAAQPRCFRSGGILECW